MTYLERDVRAVAAIRDEAALAQSPFGGALFESLVASEILKYRLGRGAVRCGR